MLKFLRENIITTNDCLILATPMILFFLSVQWYIETFQYNLNSTINYIVFFITLWIWISGCLAGWFYMLKKTLQFSKKTFLFDTDRNTALKKLFLCIFKGIGKFFISFLALTLIVFVFNIVKTICAIYVYNSIPIPNYKVLYTISLAITFFIAYWVIYWIPEIVFTYFNPFKSLVNSIKKSYIAFKQTFLYYIILVAICLFINFAIQYEKIYPVVYFLGLLLFYYIILYSIITIFRLYEKNFIE